MIKSRIVSPKVPKDNMVLQAKDLEIQICLTCSNKKCTGICKRFETEMLKIRESGNGNKRKENS